MKLIGERNFRSVAENEGSITADPPSQPRSRLSFRERGKIVAACLALAGSVFFCSRIPGWIAGMEQKSYAIYMRWNTLSDFHDRHGRWPGTMEEVIRDLETHSCLASHNCKDNEQSIIDIYHRYQPKMTILFEERDSIRVKLDFTRGYPGTQTVDADCDDGASADSGAGRENKAKAAAAKPAR